MLAPRSISRNTRTAAALAALSIAVVAALVLAATGAFADSTRVKGEVVDHVVSDGSCQVILCTHGVYTGKIKGDFEFQITALAPTDVPGVQTFVGSSTIHTGDGDLRCADSGSFNASPASSGEGVHLCVVTGGTGAYQGATGYLQERFHFVGTDGRGEYVGEVRP
jgi:hypothetical protein